jgi:thiosulfate/3-mercaptopyruvate sulfurtransferase
MCARSRTFGKRGGVSRGFGGDRVDSPLISVDELEAALGGRRPPLLLDVRWSLGGPPGLAEFRAGHLPGARFLDLDRDLAAPPGRGRGRHPLPEAGSFEAAMRRAGMTSDRSVVVYDSGGGLSAARAWWLLRYFGHRDVRLLDGGFTAWIAAGRPSSTAEPPAEEGDFTAVPGGMPTLDAAAAAHTARHAVLLDARAAERYRGDVEPVDPVAGHIPGARSVPTARNLGADGRFLGPAALRERFAAAGVESGAMVGAYCGSGVTAAHEVLALELAGIHAALYPGSWSEWVSDPDRPVATGAAPG